MRIFNELEENLEKYIEKLFKTKHREQHLQPVDIARQVAREMRRNRRVGLMGVYVPNSYAISLGPDDYNPLEPLLESLAAELQDYITEKAAEKKYILTGPVQVKFKLNPEHQFLNERLYIEGIYDRPPDEEQEQGTEPPEDTQQYTPVKVAPGSKQTKDNTGGALLVKDAGGHDEEEYTINREFTVIGRRETCDICLKDNGISRKHAVITRIGSQYIISDQASTNGTYVNGTKVDRKVLEPGDVIKLGNMVLNFRGQDSEFSSQKKRTEK